LSTREYLTSGGTVEARVDIESGSGPGGFVETAVGFSESGWLPDCPSFSWFFS
jgi:hypothetical protein